MTTAVVTTDAGGYVTTSVASDAAETSVPAAPTTAAAAAPDCGGATIKIAQPSGSFINAAVYATIDGGYLDAVGLKSDIITLGGTSEAIAAVIGGDADLATMSFETQARAIVAGAPVKVVASTLTRYGLQIVMKTSIMNELGIEEGKATVEDLAKLKGRTIGLSTLGGGGDTVMRALLRRAGLDPDKDVTSIALGNSSAAVAAFEQGRVDLVVLAAPDTYIAAQRGEGSFLFNFTKGDLPDISNVLYASLVAKAEGADAAVITCFMSALANALKDLHSDPAPLIEAIKPRFADIDDAVFADIANDYISGMPESPLVDKTLLATTIEVQNSLAPDNLITKGFEDLVDNSYVQAATS